MPSLLSLVPSCSYRGCPQVQIEKTSSTYFCVIYMCVCVCELSHFSCVQLFVTLWTVACQAPLSLGFSRQEYWSE